MDNMSEIKNVLYAMFVFRVRDINFLIITFVQLIE